VQPFCRRDFVPTESSTTTSPKWSFHTASAGNRQPSIQQRLDGGVQALSDIVTFRFLTPKSSKEESWHHTVKGWIHPRRIVGTA